MVKTVLEVESEKMVGDFFIIFDEESLKKIINTQLTSPVYASTRMGTVGKEPQYALSRRVAVRAWRSMRGVLTQPGS